MHDGDDGDDVSSTTDDVLNVEQPLSALERMKEDADADARWRRAEMLLELDHGR